MAFPGEQQWAMRRAAGWVIVLLLALLWRPAQSSAGEVRRLDDFEDLSGWSVTTSEGSSAWITQEPGHSGSGMRVGFDLNTAGGYVIVRKAFSVPLPANYAFSFYLRGEAHQNNFEFKLVDAGGKNVWWRRQRDFSFPTDWQRVTIRKSRMEFAWGSSKGRDLQRVGAIEFAISTGIGGKGSIWIDDLEFEEREPSETEVLPPTATALSSLPEHAPALMLDQDANTAWKSQAQPQEQWVLVDLQRNREYGGLTIDWDRTDFPTAFRVQASYDGTHWTDLFTTSSGNGNRDYIYAPDSESRYIRLDLQRSSRGQGYGISSLVIESVEFAASPNQFFSAIAKQEPPGILPKYFSGTQTYWTIVGVSGDGKQGLLNEEGLLEVDKGAFSLEPFLYVDGKLVTWNDVHPTQELEDGYLPIPSVTWDGAAIRLRVTAFASGKPGSSTLYANYQVENHGENTKRTQLFVAIRPYQVNPPWQSLNMTGGVAPIHDIRFDGRSVWVDQEKAVISLPAPDRFGAARFEDGTITEFLREGKVPPRLQASDPFGFASGAMQYIFDLKAGARESVDLAIPFHDPYVAAAVGLGADSHNFVHKLHEETRRHWESVLSRVEVDLPPEAAKISKAMQTTLAYVLINRNGAAIQPGPRDYARSWIRDGAVTSTALLQMGYTREVQDFIRWYATYQLPNGKVPCCVDRRGADPALEHDSPGEFINAVMEYYRFTHDIGFAADLWPQVVRAVEYLSSLRQQRMTAAYRLPEKEAYYGILPESLSHEGYSSFPVHSYWDDFSALRGLKDAAALAQVVGDEEHAASFATLRDSFRQDLSASILKTMANHKIDYIPGCVELGDFDPTSTAFALSLGLDPAELPEPALRRTFDLYFTDFDKRQNGEAEWAGYAPYELRNVDALIRLGERDRALAILNFMLLGQRPPAWNEWAEVVWRDATLPNFIGDMPHTWIGSTFVQAMRTMFAYDRESDQSLVLAAGLPAEWVGSKSGVAVKRLPTHYGILTYTAHSENGNSMRLRLSGDLTPPAGGIVLLPPLPRPLKSVKVNGKAVEGFSSNAVTIREFPAEVELEY